MKLTFEEIDVSVDPDTTITQGICCKYERIAMPNGLQSRHT